MWCAHAADFLQSDLLETLRWLRAVGDTVFALGVVSLGHFVAGLKTGRSLENELEKAIPAAPAPLIRRPEVIRTGSRRCRREQLCNLDGHRRTILAAKLPQCPQHQRTVECHDLRHACQRGPRQRSTSDSPLFFAA